MARVPEQNGLMPVCERCKKPIAILERDLNNGDYYLRLFQLRNLTVGASGILRGQCQHCNQQTFFGQPVDVLRSAVEKLNKPQTTGRVLHRD